MSMSEDGALFSLAEVGVDEAEYAERKRRSLPPRARPPVSGVRWRRTGVRRECDGCLARQHAEYRPGSPMVVAGGRATVELTVWSEEGHTVHEGFYCEDHASRLGWEPSRGKGTRKRPDVVDRQRLSLMEDATRFQTLVYRMRSGASNDTELHTLIGRLGGRGLEMPDWHVEDGGTLVGRFHTAVWQNMRDWRDAFDGDIDKDICGTEAQLSMRCRLVADPPVEIRLSGYVDVSHELAV